MDDCNTALEKDGTCGLALLNRAYCFSLLKQPEKAVADLEQLDQLHPTGELLAFAWSNRARVALQSDDVDTALKFSEMALLQLTIPETIATRGLVLSRQKRNDEALALLSEAIQMNPYASECYWFRHEVYEAIGESQKAEADKEVAARYGYAPYL